MQVAKKLKNAFLLYGSKEPKQVTFAITNHCNMACSTCSFPDVNAGCRVHAPFDDSIRAIDFLVDNGVKMVSITGGEPLLHPDFLGICEHITKRGIMISYISTNGLLVNDEIAKRLAQTSINIVGISIDAIDDRGFGITRKANIMSVAKNAKSILDKYGIETYGGILLGRHTAEIGSVLDAAKSMGFKKIIFSYPQTSMRSSYLAAKDQDFLKADPLFWKTLVSDIIQQKKRRIGLSIFNTCVNLEELSAFYDGRGYTFDCPAGVSQFYLDWNLDLYRCLTSCEKYGNVRELKDLDFENKPCNSCTQQAHRDYASFYHAFKTVKEMETALRCGNIRKFAAVLRQKKNRIALRSLFEGYLGGFV